MSEVIDLLSSDEEEQTCGLSDGGPGPSTHPAVGSHGQRGDDESDNAINVCVGARARMQTGMLDP